MTEDEVKTKACPQSLPCGSPAMPCIASACMAWRWDVAGEDALRAVMDKSYKLEVTDGFCGLAGKP